MPFQFRLQPLLDRRRREEEEKLHRYARYERERDDALRAGDRLAAAFDRHAARASEAGTLAALDAGIAALRRRAAQAQSALAGARDDLIAARRARRAIEKLRERRLHAYESDEAKRDELEIDEANARRRSR
jgi:flagellar export protein FliJ